MPIYTHLLHEYITYPILIRRNLRRILHHQIRNPHRPRNRKSSVEEQHSSTRSTLRRNHFARSGRRKKRKKKVASQCKQLSGNGSLRTSGQDKHAPRPSTNLPTHPFTIAIRDSSLWIHVYPSRETEPKLCSRVENRPPPPLKLCFFFVCLSRGEMDGSIDPDLGGDCFLSPSFFNECSRRCNREREGGVLVLPASHVFFTLFSKLAIVVARWQVDASLMASIIFYNTRIEICL